MDRRWRHRPAVRRLLGALFVVHFGAVLFYLLPTRPSAVASLPGPVRMLAESAASLVLRLDPFVARILDATASRQNWGLFAPYPAEWAASLRAVAYYADGEGAWVPDTVVVEGPVEEGYPHWRDHREYRVIFNLGYEDWGLFYRPIMGRWMCATLGDGERGGPDGVRLEAVWRPVPVPWEPVEAETYTQFLIGVTCGGGSATAGAELPPAPPEVDE